MRVGHVTDQPGGAPFLGFLPDAAARSGKGGGDLVTLDKEVSTCLWGASQPHAWQVGDEKVDLSGRVYLEGEIQLSYDMQPSCACPIFCVEYFVDMLPLRIAGHGLDVHSGDPSGSPPKRNQDSNGLEEVILERLIEVATLYPNDGETV